MYDFAQSVIFTSNMWVLRDLLVMLVTLCQAVFKMNECLCSHDYSYSSQNSILWMGFLPMIVITVKSMLSYGIACLALTANILIPTRSSISSLCPWQWTKWCCSPETERYLNPPTHNRKANFKKNRIFKLISTQNTSN